MGSTLDVVIVNWNAGVWLERALDALARVRPTAGTLARVVVVDNASTDGSADTIEARGLPLTLIHNVINRGFAAACNQGAVASTADVLLFLNPDALITTEAIDAAFRMFSASEHAGVGIAGVRLDGGAAPPPLGVGPFPTPASLAALSLGLGRRAARQAAARTMPGRIGEDRRETTIPREVDVVCGACLFIRRSVFEALGGFDERFFVYYDEVDLCLRARRHGIRAVVLDDVSIHHAVGVCTTAVPGWRLFCGLQSRQAYIRTHFRSWEVAALLALMSVPEPMLRLVRAAIGRGAERPRDVIEAYARLTGLRT
ncbi:MAG TPA: glycosyltransferase family 2 protein [Vicinamibacterales bacterium]|nr:glycosyltransferase family 2 protein [Vicinamibacterales bacterium]